MTKPKARKKPRKPRNTVYAKGAPSSGIQWVKVLVGTYHPINARYLGEWLIAWADWAESKEKP